jgi:hypothetical protein
MTYHPPVTVPFKSVPFLKGMFAGYKRRDINIRVCERMSFHDLNWSGGSKTDYTIVRLDDNATMSLASWGQLAPWANPYEGATIDMRPGFMIVSTGYFCGKVSLMNVYVHPDNMAPLLTFTGSR